MGVLRLINVERKLGRMQYEVLCMTWLVELPPLESYIFSRRRAAPLFGIS